MPSMTNPWKAQMKTHFSILLVSSSLLSSLHAEDKVDYRRDIQPLLAA
jgi:hypothetical protein